MKTADSHTSESNLLVNKMKKIRTVYQLVKQECHITNTENKELVNS